MFELPQAQTDSIVSKIYPFAMNQGGALSVLPTRLISVVSFDNTRS